MFQLCKSVSQMLCYEKLCHCSSSVLLTDFDKTSHKCYDSIWDKLALQPCRSKLELNRFLKKYSEGSLLNSERVVLGKRALPGRVQYPVQPHNLCFSFH